MQDRAGAILFEAKKKEENADKKLARAKRLMTEYQTALAKGVAQAKNEIQKELQEKSDKVLRKKSRQLSGMTAVLLMAYLVQLVAFLFHEKDTVATIPVWFHDRFGNILWLVQCIRNFYPRLYLKMTTSMPVQIVIGILILVSVIIAVVLFFLIRMGLRYLLQKWKKRWEFYESRDMELLKKCAMVGIAFMGLSISMVVVNLPFIPFKFNVVSWWILISGVMEFLYFYYDRHGF